MSKENNGWTKIENENNLPSRTIMHHVIINRKLSKALYAGKNRWYAEGNDYPKTSEMHGITHFQEIIIPEAPIF
jgi:hypothetical protein